MTRKGQGSVQHGLSAAGGGLGFYQHCSAADKRKSLDFRMYAIMVLVFLVLPAGMAVFLLWRAYQMGVNRRVELSRQWISRPPEGIEEFAEWFAWRDLTFGVGLLVCLALLIFWPRHFAAWIPLMALFGFIHQGFTGYALHKLRRRSPI